MQGQGGPWADDEIRSAERHFHVRLRVDWNGNGLFDHPLSELGGYVSNSQVDRSLKGSLPGQMLLIEGSGAAELSVELTGRYEGQSLEAIFSPFQVLSPFWGKQIMGREITLSYGIETEIGMVWYPQFYGRTRTISPDRGAGSVTITALDRVEELRRPVTFPAWAMYEYQRTVQGRVESQLADSQWVIDHCLRHGDTSPTPYRPATREENNNEDEYHGLQLWVNGTGSIVPTVGWLDNYVPQEFPATFAEMYESLGSRHPGLTSGSPSPRAMGALGNNPAEDTIKWWAQDRDLVTTLGTQALGFTLVQRGRFPDYHVTAPDFEFCNIRVGENNIMRLWIGNNQIWSTYYVAASNTTYTSTKVTIPSGVDFSKVEAAWDVYHPGGVRSWMKVGANSSGSGWTVLGPAISLVRADDFLKGLVESTHRVAWNDFWYLSTNYGSGSDPSHYPRELAWRNAKYAAALDQGLNRLSFLPNRQVDDAWNTISDIAAAELGAVFWDEFGVFRFWNYQTLKQKQTNIVRDATLDDLQSLRFNMALDSVRNMWAVTTSQAVGVRERVFAADSIDQFYVPGGTRRLFRVWSEDILSINPGKVDRYTTVAGQGLPIWDEKFQSAYVAQWLVNGVWAEDPNRVSGVDIRAYHDRDGKVVIDIYNGYGDPVRLATNDGSPALHIVGTLIIHGDDQTNIIRNKDSIRRYGGKNLSWDSDWHQEFSNINGMFDNLVNRTNRPIPSTDDLTLPGDPRLMLGDTIRVNDRLNFGERIDCQIFGYRRTYSVDEGLTDVLSVEIVRPNGGFWDDPVYGRWDQTFMWGV